MRYQLSHYRGDSSCNVSDYSNQASSRCAYYRQNLTSAQTHYYRRWAYSNLSMVTGEYIRYYKSADGTYNNLQLMAEKVGPFSGSWDTGCMNLGPYFVAETNGIPAVGDCLAPDGFTCVNCSSECDPDNPCPDGEKCVDGFCVPCEKLVDGKGVVTLWAVKPTDGSILSDGLDVDISSGVASVNTSLLAPTAGRIQIFNGMSGVLTVKAGIGILGSDFGANITLFSGSVSGHYQDFIFDFGNIPFGYAFNGKVTFEILNYDTLGDCADDDVDDTPDDPPIDVVDGGEPQPPGGSGPGTVTPPGGTNTIIKVIVIKPPPPETGCDCEKYLADALYYNFDSLGNRLIDLTNSFDARLAEQNSLIHSLFSDHNRILFEQLSESNRLAYELSLFLARKFYPELLKISAAVDSLSSDVSIIKDSLRLSPCEPDYPDGKTIAQIADDFEKHYYPATVEVLENDVVIDSGSDEPDIFCRKLRN